MPSSAASGIPSIGLGNFTWDWVYADYPRVRLAPSLLPAIRGAYAKASMALRLPMSAGFETFSNVKDIPFIARHASRTREEVCKILKIPSDKPIVLVSFGGYGLPGLDTDVLSKFKKYTVVGTANVAVGRTRKETPTAERKGAFININEEAMYDAGVRYEDLGRRRRSGRDQAGIRHHLGVHRQRRRRPLHLARALPRVRRARRGHAEIPALVVHQPRGAVRRQVGTIPGQAARPVAAEDKKPETNGADVAAEILLKALDKPPKKPRGRPRQVLSTRHESERGHEQNSDFVTSDYVSSWLRSLYR